MKTNFFRTNFTMIESILLQGEGGIGKLQIGHRQMDSSDIPIILEINANQYQLCSSRTKK